MEWPKLIKRLMRRGMSQAEIAARVGVSQSYVSKLASGIKCRPTYEYADRLRKLAGAKQ